MKQTPEYIITLWERYLSDKASHKEVEELYHYTQDPMHEEQSYACVRMAEARMNADNQFHGAVPEWMLRQILQKERVNEHLHLSENAAPNAGLRSAGSDISQGSYSEHKDFPVAAVQRLQFLRTNWFRYAAAILLLFGTGAYLWLRSNRTETADGGHLRVPADIAPGKSGAVLTLADGRQVVLDSSGNGVIATQNGSQVVLKNGQLTYDLTGNGGDAMMYNTMTTPKGRQFNVVLPDGSHVWLNAATTLKFPTVFNGHERRIELEGEAYFEVATDRTKPFRVLSGRQSVEVLGTHFNIMAYKEEQKILTTLIEGSIRASVAAPNQPGNPENALLKPGQQAQLMVVAQRALPGIKVINNADLDKVLAWKNGAFNFNDASLDEVMRQLERWYDIEVVYEKGIPDIHFVGEMSRDVSLSGLLRTLEASKVHFRMEEGRRLVVMP